MRFMQEDLTPLAPSILSNSIFSQIFIKLINPQLYLETKSDIFYKDKKLNSIPFFYLIYIFHLKYSVK